MKHSYILQTGLLPSQVKLGRFVTDVLTPDDAYHDPAIEYSPTDIHIIEDHSSSYSLDINPNTTSISIKLSKLFGISHDRKPNVTLHIQGKKITTQKLSNYTEAFNKLWLPSSSTLSSESVEKTRQWIQNKIQDDEKIFMLLSIMMVSDAQITMEEAQYAKTTVKAGLPLSEIAGLPALSHIDLILALASGRESKVGNKWEIKGERVVALEYCQINVRKWWEGKGNEVKLASANEHRWEWLLGNNLRLPIQSDPQERLIVAASLGDIVGTAEMVGETDDGDENEFQSFSVDDIDLIF